MNGIVVKQGMLRLRRGLATVGALNGLAVLLGLAGLAAWGTLPRQAQDRLALAQREAVQVRRALAAAPPVALAAPQADRRVQAFYAALGARRLSEQHVDTVLGIAAAQGLLIEQAEYRLSFDQHGQFYTYRVLLPVKGDYPAIRRFCEQVLLTLPFAAWDEIALQRASADSGAVEARLQLSLLLRDDGPSLHGAGPTGAAASGSAP